MNTTKNSSAGAKPAKPSLYPDVKGYMPKQLTDEELTSALKEIIARVGATSPKEMGKVMGVASRELAGKAEGRAISAKVKELLAE